MSSIWTVRRSATDVKVAGLCGGVAQKWDVDPILVRIAFVLLALSAGIGLILYLAGWLLLPIEGRQTAPVDDLFGEAVRKWPRELWIALVTVACVLMFVIFGSLSPFSIGPAVVIAVIWYFGFYKGRRSRRAPSGAEPPPQSLAPPAPQFVTHPGPPTPFTEAAEAWRRRIEENAAQAARSAGPVTPGYAARPTWPSQEAPLPGYAPSRPLDEPDPEAAERSRFLATPDPVGLYTAPTPVVVATPTAMADRLSARRLRLVALIVLGLALAGLGVADRLGATVPLVAYFAVALLVLGLTLVVATRLGRARGLLALALPLAVVVLTLSTIGPVWRAPGSFDATHSYRTTAELPAGDSVDVGRLTVDLGNLVVDRDVHYSAHTDVGDLQVTVPRDTNVVVHYAADLGSVRTYSTELQGGSELTGTAADPQPTLPGKPTLTLDLSVDVGNLEVRR